MRFSKHAVLFAVVAMFVLVASAMAGGPPQDGREHVFKGVVFPQAVFETVAYNDGVLTVQTATGDTVRLEPKDDGLPGEMSAVPLFVQCRCAVWDKNGITGYDQNGVPRHWANGICSKPLVNMAFRNPVRPAFSLDQVAFGGANKIVIRNRIGKPCEETIRLSQGLEVTSMAITPIGVYFTAYNGNGSWLYLAKLTKAGYKIESTKVQAEQVVYAAGHLAIVEKWGISTWLFSDEGMGRDEILYPASGGPFVLAGGDDKYCWVLTSSGVTAMEVKHDIVPSGP